ncbi:MAG: hypothetical protein QGH37_10640 [Candidatus Poribacteria bacterium]|nr:hypothetical protein [Candidatus Poribacteria bacterium]MDP6960209.1 hypothetical protein [Dehalococcoidia bacterium]
MKRMRLLLLLIAIALPFESILETNSTDAVETSMIIESTEQSKTITGKKTI